MEKKNKTTLNKWIADNCCMKLVTLLQHSTVSYTTVTKTLRWPELCVTGLWWPFQATITNACLEGPKNASRQFTATQIQTTYITNTNPVVPHQYSEKPTSNTTTFSQISKSGATTFGGGEWVGGAHFKWHKVQSASKSLPPSREHILSGTKYSQLLTVCHHQDQSAAGPSENTDLKVVAKATYSECHMHFPPLLPLAPSINFNNIMTVRQVQMLDIQIRNILQNTRTWCHNSKWQAETIRDGYEFPWLDLVIIQFDWFSCDQCYHLPVFMPD